MHCTVGISKRENWDLVKWLLGQQDIDPYAIDKNEVSVADEFAMIDQSYADAYLDLIGSTSA